MRNLFNERSQCKYSHLANIYINRLLNPPNIITICVGFHYSEQIMFYNSVSATHPRKNILEELRAPNINLTEFTSWSKNWSTKPLMSFIITKYIVAFVVLTIFPGHNPNI